MDFQAWLAAMPAGEVRRRIGEIEQQITGLQREADLMRILLARHGGSPTSPEPPESARGAHTELVAQRARRRARRLSPEREAILAALGEHADGASPHDIAHALGKPANAVQTNLSRMTEAGMVERISTGRYRLPPNHPTEGAPASSSNGTLLLDRPSGSNGEAMEP